MNQSGGQGSRSPAAPAALPDPRFGIEIPDAPPAARAVSLAGILLRLTRRATWAQLALAVDGSDPEVLSRLGRLHLSDEQLELLDAHADLIELVVAEPGGSIAVCTVCGAWLAIGRRAVPTSCRSTAGCRGKLAKAPRARRIPYAPARPDPPGHTAAATADGLDPPLADVVPLFPDGPQDPVTRARPRAVDRTRRRGRPDANDPASDFDEQAGEPAGGTGTADFPL
ncbi:hypothetical protein [Microlunatus ginsengisoli]|uniref:hypothetical protein n=1 Tax=Microlunatus ginsengisoli TaxID=363863 RepID=UPI0031E32204